MSFDLYYLGAEQAGWRTVLADNDVDRVGLSYWSLRKRMPKKGVDIESWGFAGVLLESGGYQANKKPEQNSLGEWRTYGEEYQAFALEHADDLELISEFDCLVLGPEWIKQQRREVWSQVDPHKFLPVWHPTQGLDALEELGANYPRIAISEEAVTGRGLNVTPQLNALASRGVKLHGIAMTKPTVLRQVAFSTAASTSWLSPSRFGDTLIWDGQSLTRYPMKLKATARGPRHQALLEREGFDVEKLRADDNAEVTRLALWSWSQVEASLRDLRPEDPDRSNNAWLGGGEGNEATGEIAVATPAQAEGNAKLPPQPLQVRSESEMRALPMFTTRDAQAMNLETKQTETIQLLEVRGQSARRCDTCVIKDRCGEFKPNTTCAYSLPVEIRTPEQRKAFMTAMLEIQGQRVQFAYLVEQTNGGYPDPNLSQEYDRLLKAFTTVADLEDGRDFVKISVEARGKTGVLSRLFDPQNAVKASAPAQQLDGAETDAAAVRIIEGQRVT